MVKKEENTIKGEINGITFKADIVETIGDIPILLAEDEFWIECVLNGERTQLYPDVFWDTFGGLSGVGITPELFFHDVSEEAECIIINPLSSEEEGKVIYKGMTLNDVTNLFTLSQDSRVPIDFAPEKFAGMYKGEGKYKSGKFVVQRGRLFPRHLMNALENEYDYTFYHTDDDYMVDGGCGVVYSRDHWDFDGSRMVTIEQIHDYPDDFIEQVSHIVHEDGTVTESASDYISMSMDLQKFGFNKLSSEDLDIYTFSPYYKKNRKEVYKRIHDRYPTTVRVIFNQPYYGNCEIYIKKN